MQKKDYLIILAIVIVVILGYRIFDLSVSLDYSRQETKNLKSDFGEALLVVEKLSAGMPESRLQGIANQLSREQLVVKRENERLQIGSVVFILKNGMVVGTSTVDDLE
jgi:Tfp pilus assembly protein PilO